LKKELRKLRGEIGKLRRIKLGKSHGQEKFSSYLAIAFYLKFVVRIEPWLNAIVPTVGFLLSTLTLPYFKTFWTKYIYRK